MMNHLLWMSFFILKIGTKQQGFLTQKESPDI